MGAIELGQLIKAARLRRGWQQQELAIRLNVDAAYISAIEGGKRNWPQQYVRPLADALGLNQFDMAVAAGLIDPTPRDRTGEPEEPDEVDEELNQLRLSDGLTQDRAETLAGLIRMWREADRRKPRIVDQEPVEDGVGITY